MNIIDNEHARRNLRKYNTIIIITIYPLSERDYHKYGIGTFIDNGYDVIVLDVYPLIAKNFSDITIHNTKRYKNYKQISNIGELNYEFGKYSSENTLLIVYCNFVFSCLKIYKEINNHSFDYTVSILGNLPSVNNNIPLSTLSIYKKVKRYLKILSVRAICDKCLKIIPKKCIGPLGFAPAKYCIVGGASALRTCSDEYYISDNTNIIQAHSMDYDLYLEMYPCSPSDININSNYCVFIDEYFPYHPDFRTIGIKSPVSEENYYPSLNRFFDCIEKMFNIIVIIAAHPRADYNLHPNVYSNRKIIAGKTNYLVRDAKFVIMHSSTAISYAALFKKPIIFTVTNEMIANYGGIYNELTVVFARCFGQTPINIDDDYSSLCEIPKINEKLYDKYINEYIKIKGSQDKKIWEIFIDEIEKE